MVLGQGLSASSGLLDLLLLPPKLLAHRFQGAVPSFVKRFSGCRGVWFSENRPASVFSPPVGISTTTRLVGVVEDGGQESGSDRQAWIRSWVRSGKASDDLGSRCIRTVRWSSLCRAIDTILLGLWWSIPGSQPLTCPGPVALHRSVPWGLSVFHSLSCVRL